MGRVATTFFGAGQRYVVDGDAPSVGDYFLFEAIETYAALLANDEALLALPPPLAAFRARMHSREAIAKFVAGGGAHARLTGSPKEDELRPLVVEEWRKIE